MPLEHSVSGLLSARCTAKGDNRSFMKDPCSTERQMWQLE